MTKLFRVSGLDILDDVHTYETDDAGRAEDMRQQFLQDGMKEVAVEDREPG